jgi:hypothetical protein
MPRPPRWDDKQLARVRAVALELPEVEESTSYGTPAFKQQGKLLARMHQDGEWLVVRVDPLEKELVLQAAPRTFLTTPHYDGSPYVLVRLAVITQAELKRALVEGSRALNAQETSPRRRAKTRRR